MNEAASARATFSLGDLIAFNDELIALVRAGVPLERSLGTLRSELPHRLGRITDELAERTIAGKNLSQTIDSGAIRFPPVYKALVHAGLRSGRLDLALESMAATAKRLDGLQRVVSRSLIYPVVVLLAAYELFAFFLVAILPQVLLVAEDQPTWFMRTLDGMRNTLYLWQPVFPLAVIGLAVMWWIGTRRAMFLQSGLAARVLSNVPLMGPLFKDVRLATFCDLLSILVRHEVPLPQALELAGASAGDKRWQQSAAAASETIEQGGDLEKSATLAELPPYVRWLIATGGRRGGLADLVGEAGDFYRRRATNRATWMQTFVPALLVLVVGGLAVAAYATVVFVPFVELLKQFALGVS